MVKHITNAVHQCGSMALAEMVEDASTHELINEFTIELGQGYLHGRPTPCMDLPNRPLGSTAAR